MSQLLVLGDGVGPVPVIEMLTMDDGSIVSPDGSGNIDVFGAAGANGAINIKTEGTVSGLPASTAGIVLKDSLLLPSTNSSGTQGVIALGSTSYTTDRFIHNYGSNNTFVGYQSGNLTLSVGNNANVAVGGRALINGTTISGCVAVGYQALQASTSQSFSTAVGYQALLGATFGTANTALGNQCLKSLTTGSANCAVGEQALLNLTGDASYNVAIGYLAGTALVGNERSNIYLQHPGIAGESNVMRLGQHGATDFKVSTCYIAGIRDVNTIANQKVVVINSATSQMGVSDGTAVGQTITGDTGGALSPTAGNWNILGSHGLNTSGAGSTLTVAINNAITLGDLSAIAAGSNALSATTGDINVAAGNIKLSTTSSTAGRITINSIPFVSGYGTSNYFFGPTGNVTLSGTENAMVGSGGSSMTSASANSSLGVGALNSVTSGSYQVALGYNALYSQQTNWFNIAIGYKALFASTDAGNIAIGPSAMENLAGGQNNLSCGWQSLINITSGSRNHAFGYQAGGNCTTGDSDNLFLNSQGVSGDNNTIRIGQQGSGGFQQNKCYIAGIVGVTTSNSQLVTIDSSTGQLGVTDLQPFPWSVISADQTASINQGYFCNKASTLALALPAASAVGDVIEVSNINTALGIQFTQGAGQQIFIGNTSTTLGAAGTLTSTAVGDALKLVCSTANTTWRVVSMIGNWTPA